MFDDGQEVLNQEQEQVSTEDVLVDQPTSQSAEEGQEVAEQVHKESDQEKNLRALREKSVRVERERDDALKRTKEYEQYFQQLQQKEKPQKDADPDYNISPDDLVEGKHLGKYDKKIKQLEDQLSNYQKQSQQYTAEQNVKMQYPDFDKVVNEQTVADLRASDPDLAASIAANPDIFSQAKAAYSAIKRYGIYQEDTYHPDRQKAQDNASKPRPLASVSPQQGDSPLSKANAFANGLTDELKQQLFKEMNDARKKI